MIADEAIQLALDLQTAAAMKGYGDIAWPNIEYEPVIGKCFAIPTLIPARTLNYDFENRYKYAGIYQIDVFVPIGSGNQQLYDIIKQLTTVFREETEIITIDNIVVSVMAIAKRKSERQESWYVGSIDVEYLCFTNL